jgi:hypothetical protein
MEYRSYVEKIASLSNARLMMLATIFCRKKELSYEKTSNFSKNSCFLSEKCLKYPLKRFQSNPPLQGRLVLCPRSLMHKKKKSYLTVFEKT